MAINWLIPWGICDQNPQNGTERVILYTDTGNGAPINLSFLNNSAVIENCTIVLQAPRLKFLVAEIPANNSTYYQNELIKIPGVIRIEPDVVRTPEILDSQSSTALNLTDQWAFNRTNLFDAWHLLRPEPGLPPVTIAILDTGVDPSHEDLTGVLSPHGFDWVENSSSIHDTDGHGTFLAGIISAIAGEKKGTSGIANISILPERVGSNDTGIFASRSAVAIEHAADNGARIILMGYGGPGQSPAEESAISYATQKGCILIAPAGNDASNEGHYPSDYFEVISVGSTAKTDGLSYFSNYGIFVDLVAPGEGIISTWPGNTTQLATGTSPAAALVTGAAALILEADPNLNREQISGILTSTARDLGRTGRDIYYGYGLLDIGAAVSEAQKQNLRPGNLMVSDKKAGNDSVVTGASAISPTGLHDAKRSVSRGKGVVEIPLNNGWNFVSLPSLPGSGKTSGDIFQGINTDGHTIWKYDAVTQDWIAVERQTDFTPLEGFLIYSDRSTSIPLVLDIRNGSRELNMSTGWNLVGSPNMSPISARDALASLSQGWVSLLQYNSTTQSYDPAIIPGAGGSHADSRMLSPFSAYWVYMNTAAVYRPAG